MGQVDGKIALVTGGGSGIGRATAQALAGEGARVVVTDIDDAGGRETVDAIGDAAVFKAHDVTDEDRWQAVIGETVAVPGGKLGQPQDVANVIVFLASDKSSYMTGSEVVVDHGIMAG